MEAAAEPHKGDRGSLGLEEDHVECHPKTPKRKHNVGWMRSSHSPKFYWKNFQNTTVRVVRSRQRPSRTREARKTDVLKKSLLRAIYRHLYEPTKVDG